MKLGIINGWEEKDFAYVIEKGLDCVEYCVNYKYDSNEFLSKVPEIKANSEKYGVAVGSIGRWGMDRLDDAGVVLPNALQDDKNLIDAASQLGCPVYNCGCNRAEAISLADNYRVAIDYFAGLIAYAKGKNVKIAVYNCDWSNFVYSPEQWSVVLGALPELGIKYDTSHCIGRGCDYLKEMRDWGDRIYHFHLKGTMYVDGKGYDDPPAGLDQTQWGAVMNLLYTKGYNAMVSIEPHSGKWKGAMGQWGVDFTIQYIRPFIMPDNYADTVSPYMP